MLRFGFNDFNVAIALDLPPMISDIGLWLLQTWERNLKSKGKTEKRKMVQTAIEIVTKILEKGDDAFFKEARYHSTNRFSPKKCPESAKKRGDIKHLYSYSHYARPEYFEHLDKLEEEAKRGAVDTRIKCGNCNKIEEGVKHKQCSACKKMFYCSVECQRVDWKNKHKTECKKLRGA